jgi:hypothetical protein
MELEGIIISAGVTIFSFGLMIISLASYKKYHNPKLLFISGVFVVLFVKGILFSLSIFLPDMSILRTFLYSIYSGLFDLIILILLFIATLKR